MLVYCINFTLYSRILNVVHQVLSGADNQQLHYRRRHSAAHIEPRTGLSGLFTVYFPVQRGQHSAGEKIVCNVIIIVARRV